jgi:hypothetical protein
LRVAPLPVKEIYRRDRDIPRFTPNRGVADSPFPEMSNRRLSILNS